MVTKRQTQHSFEWLVEHFAGLFSFDTPGDTARYIAFLLTGMGRDLLNGSPFFLLTSDTVGAQSTEAAAAVRLAVSGDEQAAPLSGRRRDADVDRLTLAAAVDAGVRFAHVDDVDDRFSSPVVSEVVTARDGLLRYRNPGGDEVALRGLVLSGTGIQAEAGGDLDQSTLTIHLRRPERVIETAGEWVLKNRALIAVHVATLLRWSLENPVPDASREGLPSFQLVRGALASVTWGERLAVRHVDDGWGF